jgi:hypothetical protein
VAASSVLKYHSDSMFASDGSTVMWWFIVPLLFLLRIYCESRITAATAVSTIVVFNDCKKNKKASLTHDLNTEDLNTEEEEAKKEEEEDSNKDVFEIFE